MSNLDSNLIQTLAAAVAWVLFWCGGVGGLLFLIYYCLTLPMRRAERARLVLDLIETALQQGQPVEEAIVSISASHERVVGVRFHLLAAHLEQGGRLGEALDKVPRLLPPSVAAMLRAGEKIGDLKQVLPACRQLLPDARSQVTNAKNYLAGTPFVVAPLTLVVMMAFLVFVLPKFKEIALEMFQGARLPAFSRLLFDTSNDLMLVVLALGLLIWIPTLLYLGGPRLSAWLQRTIFPFADAVAWRMPWKRKRLQRDFSAMLAILLDAGLPEAEALTLAADCTANAAFLRRARRAREALQQGVKLTEAVAALDESGEFRWRLTNASHAQGGFRRALAGWHEALDAKAFQLEQMVAQVVTSAVVLLNGLLVGSFVIAVFLILLTILNGALLW